MNAFPTQPVAAQSRLGRCISGWNRFWFTPSDPTVLGFMRVLTGLVTLYTFIAYSFDLQALLGPYAWLDLETRMAMVREAPIARSPANWDNTYTAAPIPNDPIQKGFYEDYQKTFGMPPPLPYPRNAGEAEEYKDYRLTWGQDARLLVARGRPVWSLWFHITDPVEMAVAQGIVVFISFLFVIGFCTRITSVLTWLAALSYIHRAPASLFGVDTMMVVLLMYLAVGPSGGALSVDRLVARWWSNAGPGIIRWWRGLWGRPADDVRVAPFSVDPVPSVSATVAIRLVQIHVCIIYLAAGLAKL